MAQVIQHLRGTAAQWTTNNIVVPQGELAFLIEGDGSITSIKIGNGIGTYSVLPVFDPSIAALAAHVAAADPHTQYLTPAEANAVYSALGHVHVIANVTGLQTALDNKQPLAIVLTNTTAAFTTAQETKLAGVATGATANTGTVTSVGGTGTVSGLTLTGAVTTSGSLTLGGTLVATASNFASQAAATFLAAPNGLAGVPTFRTIIAADIPTLNQSTTGSAATLTAGRTIAMTGDVAWTSASFNGGGNVTGTSTIGTNVVTLAKMAQVVTGTFLGRVTAVTGDVEALTGTQATTLINVFTSALKGLAPASAGGTTNFLRADGTWAAPAAGGGVTDGDKGDITVTATGATWTIDAGVVTPAKQADVATSTIFYRKTAGTGSPEVQPLATLKTDLSLTGTNSGDQTTIAGITGAKAQFDAAVTDGNILYVGDVTQYTDEQAQDAVGAMAANSTFVSLAYADATPSLTPSLSATGTPSITTFLRGDNTWATPSGGGGPANYQAVTKIAAYTETATSGEVIVAADLVAGFTITLPAAVGNTARLTFKKMQAAGSIVIDANAAETIDGGLTATLTRQYESITIVSDNANWIII